MTSLSSRTSSTFFQTNITFVLGHHLFTSTILFTLPKGAQGHPAVAHAIEAQAIVCVAPTGLVLVIPKVWAVEMRMKRCYRACFPRADPSSRPQAHSWLQDGSHLALCALCLGCMVGYLVWKVRLGGTPSGGGDATSTTTCSAEAIHASELPVCHPPAAGHSRLPDGRRCNVEIEMNTSL